MAPVHVEVKEADFQERPRRIAVEVLAKSRARARAEALAKVAKAGAEAGVSF